MIFNLIVLIKLLIILKINTSQNNTFQDIYRFHM